jgi:hypothetical protein
MIRPRLGLPPGKRAGMTGAYLRVFAAFSILGSLSNLVPRFLHGILGVRNLALTRATSFLIFITAAVSQAFSARLPARRSVSAVPATPSPTSPRSGSSVGLSSSALSTNTGELRSRPGHDR